jgi:hypothetical protein
MVRNMMSSPTGRFVLLGVTAALTIVACGGKGHSSDSPPVQAPGDPPVAKSAPAWLGFGSDAQHTAVAQVPTQELSRIVWSTPVDVAPQYSAKGYLTVHYGSPAITSNNTVIVPVKRAVQNQYRVEARSGATGELVWSMDSDYVMPDHNWTPSYNVSLTKANRVYAPGPGGTVLYRDDADSATAQTHTVAFFGNDKYRAAKAAFDASVFITTPITADDEGTLFFGFVALPGNPAKLTSGFARVGADDNVYWVGVSELVQDQDITKPAMNSAPAISADGKTVYVAVNGADGKKGYLLAIDPGTLKLQAQALLVDPQTGDPAFMNDNGTASPTIGPDGDVYFGVMETVYGQHNARGWLLHFDASLSQSKMPGSFGWDDTASIVNAAMVPGYQGTSKYLVTVKYNNYGRAGNGDSKNKVALLDPNATQADFITGTPVMKEVQTVMGATPDPRYPGGVLEWCINTAAVDPFSKSILVNSEDGFLYRWDMASNSLIQKVQLTSGLGESYTPTAIGPDGKVYAINNAVLFAVGK